MDFAKKRQSGTRLVKGPFQRTRLFIASSSESLPAAEALQLELEQHGIATTIWKGAFQLSRTNVENLEMIAAQVTGGIFLMSAEDIQIIRNEKMIGARDNVLLELGWFIGKLGRPHCVVLRPQVSNFRWPSDLDGLSTLPVRAELFPKRRGTSSNGIKFRTEVRRAATELARHFSRVETYRWGLTRMEVGYFLRAVRDTYRQRLSTLRGNGNALPDFRLNLMTPAAAGTLYIACVDYESFFHEREFEKAWLEDEGKCGHAWKHCVQALFGADLDIADATKVPMDEASLPSNARKLQSVLSTPVLWQDNAVGVLNFDSGNPAKETLIHDDSIRECFLMAASRVATLLHGRR